MKEISNKIYYALKSIYRYNQIKSTPHAPDILLENEADILYRRLSDLSAAEVVELINLWPDFSNEYAAQEAIDDQKLDKDLKQFMQSLN